MWFSNLLYWVIAPKCDQYSSLQLQYSLKGSCICQRCSFSRCCPQYFKRVSRRSTGILWLLRGEKATRLEKRVDLGRLWWQYTLRIQVRTLLNSTAIMITHHIKVFAKLCKCNHSNDYFHSRFAKNFIDIREREMNVQRGTKDHGRQLMNLHNNEAGRRVI